MKRYGSVIALILMLALVVVPGCGDDDTVVPQKKESRYKDLSEPWHVLHNLEAALDDRNIAAYESIFDRDNFVFHFLPLGGIPEQWGYAEETQWASTFFSGAGGASDNPFLSIDVTIYAETATWIQIADNRFPGETLLQATVFYEFTIETSNGGQIVASKENRMQVVVREIGDEWRLVTWYDLGLP